MKKQYYANGKVLLTGEYLVIDGAKAIGLPTKLGQSMTVSNTRGTDLIWEAIDCEGKRWFKSNISLYDFSPVNTTDEEVSARLQMILKNCVQQNSEFLSKWNGFKVQTKLSFDRSWGLGSSSSLYCLMADWAGINPLLLYFAIEEGSGYDVACGWADGAILYENSPEQISYSEVDFVPSFQDNLYFVYSGKKQDTAASIREYKKTKVKKAQVNRISAISEAVLECKNLSSFEELMKEHEAIVSEVLGVPTIQQERFSDYWGTIKSLGAWGGDFVLATSDRSFEDTKKYFESMDLFHVFPYQDFILNGSESE